MNVYHHHVKMEVHVSIWKTATHAIVQMVTLDQHSAQPHHLQQFHLKVNLSLFILDIELLLIRVDFF